MTLDKLFIHCSYFGITNAPINVNPVGGGGEVRAKGGDLTNFKIF